MSTMTTTAPVRGEAVLSLTGVNKRFGAVQALTDVHLDVAPGEVVALVGDNGAGKSTLVKIIAGVYQPDGGKIHFAGRTVSVGGPSEAQALGIATVFQDLALCDNLDVVANLFLGQERRFGPVMDEVGHGAGGVAAAAHPLGQDPVGADPHRRRCPGGSARPSPSPAAWWATRRWSCSTSRPPRWVSPRPRRSST